MSLFLGKIHYWLYAKIQWFEAIEEDIVQWAKEKGYPVSEWKQEIHGEYGPPTGGTSLEDVIDNSNIHGWLQERIQSAELRQAAFVTRILNDNPNHSEELLRIYKSQGIKAARAHGENLDSAEDIYRVLNDYLLEGMPCDRVTEIIQSDEDQVIWRTTACLHKPYWEHVGGDIRNFYLMRDAWISGFVSTLNSDFEYQKQDDGIRRIFSK